MFSFFKKTPSVIIRHRAEHVISRKNIAPEALKVLYRLSDAGYKAYLVGGGVRDLLLGRQPKDFDVGTDARPRDIKHLFPRCFLVGRRFRLAHVVFGKTVIETSTFRKQPPPSENAEGEEGGLYQDTDNTFGTPEEDARRRDFTVNGLFYDIRTFDVIDYVGGLADLEKKVLRSIGDPNIRFCEDPVRMMRAIRLSSKLGFKIERGTLKAISANYKEIAKAAPARVLEEIFRLFSFSSAEPCFRLMWETGLLSMLIPSLNKYIDDNGGKHCAVWKYLAEFDKVTAGRGEEIANGLRIAALYLAPYLSELEAAQKAGKELRRQTRLTLAEKVLGAVGSDYKMPKAAYYHAVHLLEELSCFEKTPPKDRTVRASRAAQFEDAVALARIRAGADCLPTDVIDMWAKIQIVDTPRHPVDSEGDETRDIVPDEARDDSDEAQGVREFRPRRRRRFRRRRSFGERGETAASAAPAEGSSEG